MILTMGGISLMNNVIKPTRQDLLMNALRRKRPQAQTEHGIDDGVAELADDRGFGDSVCAERCVVDFFPLYITVWFCNC
jgi:hypothetical protein